MDKWTNLYDVSKCTACRGCVVQCKNWNRNPALIEPFKGSYGTKSDTDEDTYTIIRFMEEETTKNPMKPVEWRFIKYQCMHCHDPACMKVCPTKCISQTEWGAVVKDYDKCVGCKYCIAACPFGIPKYRERQDKTTKCTLCAERVESGFNPLDPAAVKTLDAGSRLKDPSSSKIKDSMGYPACAKTCPTGALKFGKRDDLLKEAKQRQQELIAKGYPNATVYGEKELGGLNKLYVLTDTPDKFGLPVNPTTPAYINIWQPWIKPYGGVLIGLAALGAIGSFFSTRFINAFGDKMGLDGHHEEGGDKHDA
ncbi:MAG: 4Fe-4S dicluster domain-containing protein [Firmicutes bacterium]|nr:4Fe-4S dicluster domain-containing protein [Bacillota bacterium]